MGDMILKGPNHRRKSWAGVLEFYLCSASGKQLPSLNSWCIPGGLGVRDACVGFPLLEIFFVTYIGKQAESVISLFFFSLVILFLA